MVRSLCLESPSTVKQSPHDTQKSFSPHGKKELKIMNSGKYYVIVYDELHSKLSFLIM